MLFIYFKIIASLEVNGQQKKGKSQFLAINLNYLFAFV